MCRGSRIGRTAVFAGWLQAEEMERQHADALKAAQAARFVVRTLKILDHCYGCFCETVIDMACDYMAVYVFFRCLLLLLLFSFHGFLQHVRATWQSLICYGCHIMRVLVLRPVRVRRPPNSSMFHQENVIHLLNLAMSSVQLQGFVSKYGTAESSNHHILHGHPSWRYPEYRIISTVVYNHMTWIEMAIMEYRIINGGVHYPPFPEKP